MKNTPLTVALVVITLLLVIWLGKPSNYELVGFLLIAAVILIFLVVKRDKLS